MSHQNTAPPTTPIYQAQNKTNSPNPATNPPASNPQTDHVDPDVQSTFSRQSDWSEVPSQQPQEPLAPVHPTYTSVDKEHPPIPVHQAETIPYMEVGIEQEIDPELAEYMSRVEKDKLELSQPIVVHGELVVEPPNWHGQPSINLPTTKTTILTGLKQNVNQSVRWLATWCLRMFKKFQGRVIYSDAPYKSDQ